jgi:hypothetical protein
VHVPRRPGGSRIGVRFEVLESGTGCTSARDLARGWASSASCAGLVPGTTCQLGTTTCEPVRGGAYSPLANVLCLPAGGRVELLAMLPCAPGGIGEAALWGINLACPAVRAYPLGDAVQATRRRHCPAPRERGVTCVRLEGFFCTASFLLGAPGGRCVRESDPFVGFDYSITPFDP